jgi:phosphate uptake regulator
MRTAFHHQLETLSGSIAEMCALAGQAMQDATQALLHADAALAERVIGEHATFMDNAARAEQDAFTLLALQAPVAGDLRAVVASLKNVADAERMGALALHVAEMVRRRHPAHAYRRISTATSPKWRASPSLSALTPNTLCCAVIRARPRSCVTMTTPWTSCTAGCSP